MKGVAYKWFGYTCMYSALQMYNQNEIIYTPHFSPAVRLVNFRGLIFTKIRTFEFYVSVHACTSACLWSLRKLTTLEN